MSKSSDIEKLRQALDASVLTHTGRSIGDLASQRVIDDIWPLIQALAAPLVEIAQAVANMKEPRTDSRQSWNCGFCGAYLITRDHEADCLVLGAHALLNQRSADGGE